MGGFSFSQNIFRSPIAQLVEQLTVNQWVAGSSPAGGANINECRNNMGIMKKQLPYRFILSVGDMPTDLTDSQHYIRHLN